MMPLAQVAWLGLSAGFFAIWLMMLGNLPRALGRSVAADGTLRAAILGRLAGMTAALLILNAVGLFLWPP